MSVSLPHLHVFSALHNVDFKQISSHFRLLITPRSHRNRYGTVVGTDNRFGYSAQRLSNETISLGPYKDFGGVGWGALHLSRTWCTISYVPDPL